MTASKREQILQKIGVLLAAQNMAGVQIGRARTIPVDRAEGTTIIYEGGEAIPIIQSVTPAPVDWTFTVDFKVIARGEVPDSVADPALIGVHAAMLSDISLGGLAMTVEPGNQRPELLDADEDAVIFTLEYMIRFRNTVYADLTS